MDAKCINMLALFPGLSVFTVYFCPQNTQEGKTRPSLFFHQSSTPEHYCEHKRKVKTGEVWERGYHHAACECTLDNVPYFL